MLESINATPTPNPPPPAEAKETPQGDVEQRIRIRAYELFVERGDGPGDAVSDWIQAETEIAGKAAQSQK